MRGVVRCKIIIDKRRWIMRENSQNCYSVDTRHGLHHALYAVREMRNLAKLGTFVHRKSCEFGNKILQLAMYDRYVVCWL